MPGMKEPKGRGKKNGPKVARAGRMCATMELPVSSKLAGFTREPPPASVPGSVGDCPTNLPYQARLEEVGASWNCPMTPSCEHNFCSQEGRPRADRYQNVQDALGSTAKRFSATLCILTRPCV